LKRLGIAILLLFCAGTPGEVLAQVQPPRRPSRQQRSLEARHDENDLEQRYKDLGCAMVLIISGDNVGTGFYVSSDGDFVTAAHVLGDRVWSAAGTSLQITFNHPAKFRIQDSNGKLLDVLGTDVEVNYDAWGADVARVRTHAPPPCWLRMDDDSKVLPGQHVISLGFPGTSFGSLTILNGFVSARQKQGIPIGTTVQGGPVMSTNDFLQVEMPISPGFSGAPIIDDDNGVVAVVSSAGIWSPELEVLTGLMRNGQLRDAPNTISAISAVATLAEAFHDYGSPGYGETVPLSYLKKAEAANPQPEQPDHSLPPAHQD
jgi:S1-C subfamily serine protease